MSVNKKIRKIGTIVAQNKEHSLFKLFSGRVVTKEYIIKQMDKGHRFYDLKNGEFTYAKKDNGASYIKTVGDSSKNNNLGNVPEVELHKFGASKVLKGSLVCQNLEHTRFKMFGGKVVSKQYLVKQIDKGHKFYNLNEGEITYVKNKDGTTYLKTHSDESTKNNLGNVPETDLILSKNSIFHRNIKRSGGYAQLGGDRRVWFLRSLIALCLVGAIIIIILLPLKYCSGNSNPNYIGNMTGTNWKGYKGGSLYCEAETETTAAIYKLNPYTMNGGDANSYQAHNLIIPNRVKDDNGKIYYLAHIGEEAFSNDNLSGKLVIPDSVASIDDKAFFGCINFFGTLTMSKNITNMGRDVFGISKEIIESSYFNINSCSFFSSISNDIGVIGHFRDSDLYNSDDSSPIYHNNEFEYRIMSFGGVKALELVCDDCRFQGQSYGQVFGTIGSCAYGNNFLLPTNISILLPEAFEGCVGIKCNGLVIPNTVTNIGTVAFANCLNLNGSLTLSTRLSSVQQDAFMNTNFSTIINPDGQCGNYHIATLGGVKALLDGEVDNKISKIVGSCAFGNNLEIWDSTEYNSIVENFALNCSGIRGSLVIPQNVTEIGDSAFNGTNISSLSLGNVNRIGGNSFHLCRSLNTIDFGTQTQVNIGNEAFSFCDFTTLNIPSSFKSDVGSAFGNNSNLTNLNINYGCTLNNRDFIDCENLSSITFDYFDIAPTWDSGWIIFRNAGTLTNEGRVYSTGSWSSQNALQYSISQGLPDNGKWTAL